MDNRIGQMGYDPRAVRTGGIRNRSAVNSRAYRAVGTMNEMDGITDGSKKKAGTCKMGCAEQSPLMRRLQELDLSLIDTGLFLDAYPDNQDALNYYKRLGEERARVLAEYERQYGPLTLSSAGEKNGSWDWIRQPWPWESWETRDPNATGTATQIQGGWR